MNKKEIIDSAIEFVKKRLAHDSSGHDWWHAYRVWVNAKNIGKNEGANMLIVELAALLHDVADYKLLGGDETIGPKIVSEWLTENGLGDKEIEHIIEIVKEISFKGANVKTKINTIEGKVVQDADRLDAIGAIGIARNFAFGGSRNRALFDPNIKPKLHDSFEQYKNNDSSTINHFYEKSLLLKDLMNTDTAKQIARHRHEFMEEYLKEFFDEWEGKI